MHLNTDSQRRVIEHRTAVTERGEVTCLETSPCRDHVARNMVTPLVEPLAVGESLEALVRAYYVEIALSHIRAIAGADGSERIVHFGFTGQSKYGARRGKACALHVPGGYVLIGLTES